MNPRVLLLTNELDVGSDLVVRVLRERDIPYLRVNTERMSARNFTWLDGVCHITTHRGSVCLTDVRSVWLRQPVWPSFDASPAVREVLQNQWRAAIRGLAALGATWMNSLDAGLAAESKILQLATAKRIGFDVPATCVSNDVDAIRRFVDEHGGRVVVKALDAPLIEEDGVSRFVYTSRLDPMMLVGRSSPELVPMVFQEEVCDKKDVRVLTIDGDVLAFAVTANLDGVDWRRNGRNAAITRIDVPDEIASKCLDYIASLGLRFGAFDFAVANERYAFLECNQNGEWGWLQRATGAPVAESIANALSKPCSSVIEP